MLITKIKTKRKANKIITIITIYLYSLLSILIGKQIWCKKKKNMWIDMSLKKKEKNNVKKFNLYLFLYWYFFFLNSFYFAWK